MVEQGADWEADAGWPGHPANGDPVLALNRMGTFDWDLDTGLMSMDAQAHLVFDVRPEEYDGHPETLAVQVPPRGPPPGRPGLRGPEERQRELRGVLPPPHPRGRPALDPHPGLHPARRDGPPAPHHRHRPGRHRGAARLRDPLPAGRRDPAQHQHRRGHHGDLAHANTTKDVIDVLRDTEGLAHLGAASLVMGLVEAGRIHLVAEGPAGAFVPGTRFTRIDEPYPMSEVVRTLTPASSNPARNSPSATSCGRTSPTSTSPRPPICR